MMLMSIMCIFTPKMHMMLMSMTGQKNRTSFRWERSSRAPQPAVARTGAAKVSTVLRGSPGRSFQFQPRRVPEVVGVDGVVVVIVEGGGVLGEEPPEVEARGKGQGEEQQGPRPAEDAGGKPQPLPLADGEEQVQGGEDEHLGLAGHGEAVEQGGGLVLLPVQEEHREQEDGGAEGIGLAPLGGVDQHRRAEQVGRRQEQPRLLPQAAPPANSTAAAQPRSARREGSFIRRVKAWEAASSPRASRSRSSAQRTYR